MTYYFYTPTCGACASTGPIIDKMIAEGYDVKKININQDRRLWNRYNLTGTPSFVSETNGRTHDHTGAFTESYIKSYTTKSNAARQTSNTQNGSIPAKNYALIIATIIALLASYIILLNNDSD